MFSKNLLAPSRLWLVVSAVLLFAVQSMPAQAYLDPVTASFVIQGVVGGFMAALAGIRSFRRRVLAFFFRKKPEAKPEANDRPE